MEMIYNKRKIVDPKLVVEQARECLLLCPTGSAYLVWDWDAKRWLISGNCSIPSGVPSAWDIDNDRMLAHLVEYIGLGHIHIT